MYLILTTALEDRYNYCISLYKGNYDTELGRSRKVSVILDYKVVEVSPWEVTFKQLSEVCFLHISKMHASLSTHSISAPLLFGEGHRIAYCPCKYLLPGFPSESLKCDRTWKRQTDWLSAFGLLTLLWIFFCCCLYVADWCSWSLKDTKLRPVGWHDRG